MKENAAFTFSVKVTDWVCAGWLLSLMVTVTGNNTADGNGAIGSELVTITVPVMLHSVEETRTPFSPMLPVVSVYVTMFIVTGAAETEQV